MRVFDLHNDTVYRAATGQSSLFDPSFELSVDRLRAFDETQVCCAVWIPDEYRGEAARSLFDCCLGVFYRDREHTDRHKMWLTVESGAVLGGDISRFDLLSQHQVRAMTLTWNGENELGGGAMTDIGLSAFGKACVHEMERRGIAVDISHASDRLLHDVLNIAERPMIATHSNARAVADSPRNLPDAYIRELIERGGLIGLTYHNAFLNTDPDRASIFDLVRHAEHILNLGGENVLALGSDFDGGTLPGDFKGVEDLPVLHSRFVIEFGAAITEKIFCENACNFFRNFDIQRDL